MAVIDIAIIDYLSGLKIVGCRMHILLFNDRFYLSFFVATRGLECTYCFLMTDSICHSSLRRAVLETVALTSIEFCINLRKKVDHVCVLVRH